MKIVGILNFNGKISVKRTKVEIGAVGAAGSRADGTGRRFLERVPNGLKRSRGRSKGKKRRVAALAAVREVSVVAERKPSFPSSSLLGLPSVSPSLAPTMAAPSDAPKMSMQDRLRALEMKKNEARGRLKRAAEEETAYGPASPSLSSARDFPSNFHIFPCYCHFRLVSEGGGELSPPFPFSPPPCPRPLSPVLNFPRQFVLSMCFSSIFSWLRMFEF